MAIKQPGAPGIGNPNYSSYYSTTPSGYVTTTQQFIGGEIKTVDDKGQTLEIIPGGPSPGGFGSRGFGGSGPVQQLKVYTSPFKTMDLEKQFREQRAREGYSPQEIDLLVKAQTDTNLSRQIQQGGVDSASVLLSRIQSKKLQEEVDSKLREPLQQIESEQEALVRDIDKFSKDFGGRGLTDSEFAVAQRQQQELIARQKALEQKTSEYNFSARVESVKAQQKAIEQQKRFSEQLSGQATIQSILRQPSTKMVGVSDTKSPLLSSQIVLTQTPELLEKRVSEKLPESVAIGVSSKELFVKTSEFGDTFKSELTGQEVKFKELEQLQASTVQSAGLSKVGPEDILMFTPGLSGRFFGSLTSLAGKGLSVLPGTTAVKTFITPTIRFTKFSPIKETAIIKGKVTTVIGKGKIISEQAGLIAKIKSGITRQPLKFTEVKTPIKYTFDITKKYALKGPSSIGKVQPVGSPFTLQGFIPESRLAELIKTQSQTIRSLKGRVGFESVGRVEIGKVGARDVRFLKELTDVFPKSPRVRVAPIGLDGKQITFKLKTSSVGETLSGAKIKGVQLSKELSLVRQKIRTQIGPKFDVVRLQATGKAPGVFDFGKVAVERVRSFKPFVSENLNLVKSGKDTLLATKNLVKSSGPKISVPASTKSSVAPLVSKEVKRYLDVYGLQSALKPAKTLSSQAIRLSVPMSFSEEVQRVSVGSIPGSLSKPSLRVETKISSPTITRQRFDIASITKAEAVTRTSVRSFADTSIKQAQIVIPKVSTQTLTRQTIATATRQQVRLTTRTLTRTATKTLLKTPVSPRVAPRIKIPPIPTVIIGLPSFKFGPYVGSRLKQKKLLDVFDVEVRKKGKFVKVATGLPRGLAKTVGKNITGREISRTFRLTPRGQKFTRDIPLPRLDQYRLPKGRSSLRGPMTFVEKSRFAIDSPTEKRTLREARLKRVFQ